MITTDQIQERITAEPGGPAALTDVEIMLLENLVKQYPVYAGNIQLFGGLHTKLLAVRSQDITQDAQFAARTYFLRAVLVALNELPAIRAESSGTDKAPSYFSVKDNWYELAQDVLNLFYNAPTILGKRNFVLVQRTIQDIALYDNSILKLDKTGRRF